MSFFRVLFTTSRLKLVLLLLCFINIPIIKAQQKTDTNKKPFTAEDLVQLKRISSPQISPDDRSVVYVVRSTDMEANRGRTDLWITDIESKAATQLTTDKAADHSPKWSADGRYIYFISSRSDSSQVWQIDTKKKNRITQVTNFPLDVSSFKLSRDSKSLLFSASVYPNCKDFNCTAEKLKVAEDKKHTGQVYDKMFVRHWDHWIGETQSQLFLISLNNKGLATKNRVISVSKSVNANVPSDPFGGDEEYNFSADDSKIYFSARLQNAQEPMSTNFDLYSVNLDSPDKAKLLTKNNLAWDTAPVISHSGETMAHLAMTRAGFEADRLEVILTNLKTGKTQRLTKNWDRSFSSLAFSKDDESLYLTGNNLGTKALWKLDIASGKQKLFNREGYISSVSVGNNKLVFSKDSLKSPSQLFVADLDGRNQHQITNVNKSMLNKIKFGDYEQFSFKGWNNETVHGYIVKPADFVEGKNYPLAFLIHGGPQGSFGDHFHYRWNPQTYTGQGFVAVMIDFHGSTGYGQDFTDSITQNWGNRPLEDLQKGLAFALNKYPFIDGNKACALGASYGGYMVNWIAGNWQNQFKCLVNHDGIFDNRMMYYSTEELWFVEWENGGSYFEQPEKHEKFNPVNYVKNWKTPMLVIQGGRDYRIPETQSLATFTALQKLNIPSKLLYFPDENHWVLKPANSIQWHNEVNQWLHQYLN